MNLWIYTKVINIEPLRVVFSYYRWFETRDPYYKLIKNFSTLKNCIFLVLTVWVALYLKFPFPSQYKHRHQNRVGKHSFQPESPSEGRGEVPHGKI